MATIEARLESSQDPDERRPLLKRLASLKEEQTEDYKGALETIAKLLHEDVADETTWGELERLAKVASAEARLAEIYAPELDGIRPTKHATAKLARRTGELFAKLGQHRARAALLCAAPTSSSPSRASSSRPSTRCSSRTNAPRSASSSTAPRSTTATSPQQRTATLHTIAAARTHALCRSRPRHRHLPRRARSGRGRPPRARRAHRALPRAGRASAIWPSSTSAAPSKPRALRRRRSACAGAAPHAELGNAERRDRSIRAIVGGIARPRRRHRRSRVALRRRGAQGPRRRDPAAALRARRRLASPDRAQRAAARAARKSPAKRSPSCARTRELWEKRGKDEQQALEALRAAFALDPDDGETRAELERLAEKTSSWDALAAAYEHGIGPPTRSSSASCSRRWPRYTTSAATIRAARSAPTSVSSRSTRPTTSRSSRWTAGHAALRLGHARPAS